MKNGDDDVEEESSFEEKGIGKRDLDKSSLGLKDADQDSTMNKSLEHLENTMIS